VLKSIVYFGCVTEPNFNGEKAFRFLHDINEQFTEVYKGNLKFILK